MKVILVDQHYGHTKTIVLKGWLKGLLSLCLLGAPLAFGYYGYHVSSSSNNTLISVESTLDWENQLKLQSQQLDEIKQESAEQLEAMTLRLAQLQARLMRLDALGERVSQLAELDESDFDIELVAAAGGPDIAPLVDFNTPNILGAIEELELQLGSRQLQLQSLEALLNNKQDLSDTYIAGKPVEHSWISSGFGRRADPFTGKPAFHAGIDFSTGKSGSDIISVAAGVVTVATPEPDSAYGLMVEINHGNGYSTRYGHAEKLLVHVGDIVAKGQNIALIGSTGRSTGPHLHFEVYKNGRVVDPASYVRRTHR
ncbi:MAG: hypothetical protein COC19_08190 [SAR86 cluster bacterium]|uniref:M23ase beta-sheet core domain-containing protein n=1 Tax=SAR86 cluster bacterium TaxID=2030880 RepID=A0A2A4MGG5_9GAMM|nr:MAG: hypothetical protein COC19_08190 [SAR86 cluster bacterium]